MYRFVTECGDCVCVAFEEMIAGQDVAGYLTLPDGRVAKRLHEPQKTTSGESGESRKELPRPMVSDALGFPENCFREFERDRQEHGFRQVEFVRQPEANFYGVRFGSDRERRRYLKHRGMHDRNGSLSSGAVLSRRQIEQARELVSRA